MDSMQLPLVGGLVALLVLLLVVRSVGRRRAARAAGGEADMAPFRTETVDADEAGSEVDDSVRPEAEPDAAEVASVPELVGLDLLDPVDPDLEVLDAPAAEDGAGVGLPDAEPVVPRGRRRWFRRRRRGASASALAATIPDETVDPPLRETDPALIEAGPMLHGWPEQPDAMGGEAQVGELPEAPAESVPAAMDAEAALDQALEPAPELDSEQGSEPELEPESEPEVTAEPQEEPAEEQAQPVAVERRGLFRRRRKSAAPAVESAVDPDPDAALLPAGDTTAGPEHPAEVPDASHPGEAAEQSELKALREQLRALELVVQQQSADHPTATLSKVEESVAEQSAAYLRQVSLVVSGLAAHTSEDENPRRTLARVAAAVERLGVPNSMERPILPVSHELPSGSHDDGARHPSHLLEPQEPAADQAARPGSSQVADVFAGLDAAVAPAHPAAPAGAGAAEPLLAPLIQPSPPQPVEPDPTATMPTFGQPTGNVHDLSALAAYDSDYDEGHDPAAESGIPAFEEPPAVLPVPPPAAPEQSRRRRGRKSRSS